MKAEIPFQQLKKIFQKSNQEDKELLKYVFEKSDSVSLWVIGLSIGGIAIFGNNIADIQKSIPPYFLHPILILLAVSVSVGIIYRSLFLSLFSQLNQIQRGIDIAFSDEKAMDQESILTGQETFNDLISKVRDNLGDLSYLIIEYGTKDEIGKALLYKSVVDAYLSSVDFAKKSYKMGLDFIADTISVLYGVKKERVLKKMNSKKNGVRFKLTRLLVKFLYLAYLLSFIAALFLFIIGSCCVKT